MVSAAEYRLRAEACQTSSRRKRARDGRFELSGDLKVLNHRQEPRAGAPAPPKTLLQFDGVDFLAADVTEEKRGVVGREACPGAEISPEAVGAGEADYAFELAV